MSADRLTILAVDDERTQLEDLARLLRSFPSVEDVECASDGHDALVKASTERYDAIFLDVRMPDIDGLELGRVLRRFAAPPQLVFVSAYDNAAVDAFELRALDYLRKPVSRRRVEEALERVAAAVDAAGPTATASERQPRRALTGDSEMIAVASRDGGADPSDQPRLRCSTCSPTATSSASSARTAGTCCARRSARSNVAGSLTGSCACTASTWPTCTARSSCARSCAGPRSSSFGDGQTIPIARRQVNELGRRLGV